MHGFVELRPTPVMGAVVHPTAFPLLDVPQEERPMGLSEELNLHGEMDHLMVSRAGQGGASVSCLCKGTPSSPTGGSTTLGPGFPGVSVTEHTPGPRAPWTIPARRAGCFVQLLPVNLTETVSDLGWRLRLSLPKPSSSLSFPRPASQESLTHPLLSTRLLLGRPKWHAFSALLFLHQGFSVCPFVALI